MARHHEAGGQGVSTPVPHCSQRLDPGHLHHSVTAWTHLGRPGPSSPFTLSPYPFLISSLSLTSPSLPPSLPLLLLLSSRTSLPLPPSPCTASFLPSFFGKPMPYLLGHRVTLPLLFPHPYLSLLPDPFPSLLSHSLFSHSFSQSDFK